MTPLRLILAVGSLTGCVLALTGAEARRPQAVDRTATLRELGDGAGLEVGAAVAWKPLREDAGYAALAGGQFHALTPENALKWAPIEHIEGQRDLSRARDILNFAQVHNQQVRGHALLWDLEVPSWVSVDDGPALTRAMAQHLQATVREHSGQIAVWDVVNEALDERGQLKATPVLRHAGPSYIASAFRSAHSVDPAARLFYNDYAVLWPGDKADGLGRLLDQLLASRVPIHGVGLQSHLHLMPDSRLDWTGIARHLKSLGDKGLEVHLTEVDVRVADLDGALHGRLLAQAQALHRLVSVCRMEPACTRVTFWGISDRYSWVDRSLGPDDPLLWDEDLHPKPALYAVQDALRGVPWSECAMPQMDGGDFEDGMGSMGTTGGRAVRTGDAGHGRGLGLRVTERTASWQGPELLLTGTVSEGLDWRVRAQVRVEKGAPLQLTLRIVDGKGTRYVPLEKVEGSGEWMPVSAVFSLSLSPPVEHVSVYWEGPSAGTDIDIDAVTLNVACEGGAQKG